MNAQQDPENIWYVDSGCSNHMIGKKGMFTKLDENFNSEVKLGDGKWHKMAGKGAIAINTKASNSKLI